MFYSSNTTPISHNIYTFVILCEIPFCSQRKPLNHTDTGLLTVSCDFLAPGCWQQLPLPSAGMKTKSALKRRCKDCFFVRRRGHLFVFCKTNPRHKQRQG
uniref:Ribosomal protein n=1 Tax=Acanthochromis polyacanthus TaxID=80966 RepID=A0A3Q1FYQ6_9TELE